MTFANKIAWIKCLQLFNSFWANKCFVLFEEIFLLRLDDFALKAVPVVKFACANLPAKFSVVSLLNSGVVIYLLWLWPVSFVSVSVILVS